MFIYRELTLKMIWDMFFDCTASMGGMNYTMAVAGALSAVFVYHGFGEMVQNFFFSISTNPVVIMSPVSYTHLDYNKNIMKKAAKASGYPKYRAME